MRSSRGEKSAGKLQYLVGFAQLLVLAFQPLQALQFGCGDAVAHAGLNLIALALYV